MLGNIVFVDITVKATISDAYINGLPSSSRVNSFAYANQSTATVGYGYVENGSARIMGATANNIISVKEFYLI